MSELQSFHANNTSIIVGYIVCFNVCKFGQPIRIVVCNDENVRTLLFLLCKKEEDYFTQYNNLQYGQYFIFRHTNYIIDSYKCVDHANNFCSCIII
jgi:hypothetical protein